MKAIKRKKHAVHAFTLTTTHSYIQEFV